MIEVTPSCQPTSTYSYFLSLVTLPSLSHNILSSSFFDMILMSYHSLQFSFFLQFSEYVKYNYSCCKISGFLDNRNDFKFTGFSLVPNSLSLTGVI